MPGVYVLGGRKRLVESIVHGMDKSLAEAFGAYFAIQCPHCEAVAVFEHKKDLPAQSIPCLCPDGYLLEYDRLGEKRPRSTPKPADLASLPPIEGRTIARPLSADEAAGYVAAYESVKP